MPKQKEIKVAYERMIIALLEESRVLTEKYNRLLVERNQYIANCQALTGELNEVYGSKKWKIALKLANLMYKLFPQNSRRRACIKGIYSFLRGKRTIAVEKKHAQTLTEEEFALKNRPKISIIMPVYNVRESYLRDAIESVLAQVYSNWELCIVDDASTESYIRPTLEAYAASDPRIKVIFSKENQYISAASNKAIKMATGKYIGFLDNDDMLCPEALLLCVDWLNRCRNDVALLYTDNYTIDSNNCIIGTMRKPDWSPEAYLATNYIVHFCLYSAKLLHQIGGLNEEDRFRGVQDIEIKSRLWQHTNKIEHLPNCVYKWRCHSGSVAAGISEKRSTFDNSVYAFQHILDENYGFPQGRIVMPVEAQLAGNGYFSVVFPKKQPQTLVIVLVPMERMANPKLIDTLQVSQYVGL